MNTHLLRFSIGALLLFGLVACGDASQEDAPPTETTTTTDTTPTTTTDTTPACTPGSLGCVCDDQGACDDSNGPVACIDNLCKVDEPTCEVGTEGCPCFGNQTCNGDLSCNEELLCEVPPACTPGSIGCECDSGACDAEDAFCDFALGTCQRVDCPAGEEGCACGPQGRCGVNADDEPLSCVSGVCQSNTCPPGDDGCVCRGGFGCGSEGSSCTEGFCMSDLCTAGEEGCLCAGGTCNTGLRCQNGIICVDNTGFAQGACTDAGLCNRGNRCQNDVCVTCTLGSQGCGCRDDNSCNNGLGCSDDGLCVNDRGLAEDAPSELVCYTPCSQGVELDNGRFLPCPADGLIEGCFEDTTCVQGQCLREGAEPRTCEVESDCPDFQTCLDGLCASNCRTTTDCVGGATCSRHVCRQTCTVADEAGSCGRGFFCELIDGDNGVCTAVVPLNEDISQEPIDTFAVSPEAINIAGIGQGQPVTITNTSPSDIEVTVTRRSQRLFESDGSVRDLSFEEGCVAPACPMWWLDFSANDETWGDPVHSFTIPSGASVDLDIAIRQEIAQPRWQGALDISSPNAGTKTVILSTNTEPTGQWLGEAYYFGSFKDNGLQEWVADKDNAARVDDVENAFLRLWINFRQGRLSFEQFQAGLTATRTESWRNPRIYDLGCDPGNICYPFDNFDGFLTYSTDPINIPVPLGVVEMPMAFNVRPAVGPELNETCQEGHCFQGRIESTVALQYAGLPNLNLSFADNPKDCVDRAGDECLAFIDRFDSNLSVGARYNTTSSDAACNGLQGLRHARVPWLVEGLVGRSELDLETGQRYTYECLDVEAPLPGANPVPDGRLRYRQIDLIDGALINNDIIFIIFRERLETFLWETPNQDNKINGYGYMVLRKSEAAPQATEFVGQDVPERDNDNRYLRNIECSDSFLSELGIDRDDLLNNPDITADTVARAVIDGIVTDTDSLATIDPDTEAVHYLCEDTGLIDGGPNAPRQNVACPEGSRITFFTLSLEGDDPALLDNCGSRSPQDCHLAYIKSLDCQTQTSSNPEGGNKPGSCQSQLNSWTANNNHNIRLNPYFVCQDPNRALCNDNRLDLRDGKSFFAANDGVAVLRPILTEVGDAFRYRTRFTNRNGIGLGFVPQICDPGTDLIPYCYDPAGIEDIRERYECGIELYTDFYEHLDEELQQRLLANLEESFSFSEETNIFNQRTTRRGFEFLDAELMIMLGDEHYSRALASRFDLAGNRVSSFEGELFEVNGFNLSGIAGAEMHNLYTSVQYYQIVLDRFYDLSPKIASAIRSARDGNQPSFITPAAVESYFGRLIRASTQKSRAWADIAERYQNFNRPDLSRRVIERAYTATYLESMILTRLMQEIVEITAPEDIEQIQKQIEIAQRTYRVAMSVMRQHYININDDLNYFGFAPDFIPFPALQGLLDSSFEVSRQRALERISLAQAAESLALDSDKDFLFNSASFQNELARIENTYDGQLSEICGTFSADGQIVPAISKYAYLNPATRQLGDPCGLVGTGQIHTAMIELDVVLTDLRRMRQSIANTIEEANIEERRWNASCGVTNAFARLNYRTSGQINNVQTTIDLSRSAMAAIDRTVQDLSTISQLAKCAPLNGECGSSAILTGATAIAFGGYQIARAGLDATINFAEAEVRDLQRGVELQRDNMQCDLTAIDGQARVATINLRLKEQRLEALKIEYQIEQAVSNIQQLRNQATRLQQEMAETEQLAINIEAARNNPNARIYRNDAILNADITFYSALREVYKATRVFEYYTSQSYAPLEQLFLTRMVSRGDFNLQLYMIELEDAFRAFEDQFGLPSRRLQIVSLKNDILNIPRINTEGDGAALSSAERTNLFRQALADPNNLDENGYITLRFSTSDASLSPLTRVHKISHVEAEIIGGGQGDLLARIYLRMAGTSRVAPLDSFEPLFYTFPERLAVINTFFEGAKPAHIDPDIYRNRNLVDRPLVNSHWEFVLNTIDEEVNQDLNLQSLDDIRLYIYYNDFTQF